MITNSLISPITQLGMNAGPSAVTRAATPAEATSSFATFLKSAIDSVAAQEQNANDVTDQFMIGKADVNDVMIASSKAELSLSLTSQVRNKVVEAYQEIMRMQM